MAILANGGAVLGVAGALLSTGALQMTGGALPAATQYSAYSQSLAAYTYNGTPPYSFSIASNGINAYSISGQNLTATPNIPWPADNITIQASDSSSPRQTAVATFSVAVNYVLPAGAASLGYTQLLFINYPTVAQIYFDSPGNGGTPWYSGWPFGSPFPPESLYGTSSDGGLQMNQLGTVSGGPDANTPWLSGVQLSNGTGVPPASTLPLITLGDGYYVDYGVRIINPSATTRPAVFEFPTQHNDANTQDLDPFDNTHRFLENDTWEGAGTNEKQPPGWNGATVYWYGATNANTNHIAISNATTPAQDVTKPHVYGKGYQPSNAESFFWLDNAPNGSAIPQTPSGNLTAEQLAFLNAMTYYLIIAALNDGTTPYGLVFYYVAVYGPPS